jgi:DNA invertase Pin-like site-specific DNA recombinase
MAATSGVEQGKRCTSAREYLRVSLDRSGRARSLAEQHADHFRVAGEQGWTLMGESYRDESVSASRYSRKTREGFDALIADLEQDRFGAQVLMIWESSRGSRRVGEWVRLLELCEQRAVSIFVTTHGRSYEPGNGRDRRSLLEDAVDSEYESAKISTRARRAAAANAVAGRPHGRIPYGYRRVFHPQTRVLIAQEPEPAEAEVIAELYRRLIQGTACGPSPAVSSSGEFAPAPGSRGLHSICARWRSSRSMRVCVRISPGGAVGTVGWIWIVCMRGSGRGWSAALTGSPYSDCCALRRARPPAPGGLSTCCRSSAAAGCVWERSTSPTATALSRSMSAAPRAASGSPKLTSTPWLRRSCSTTWRDPT